MKFNILNILTMKSKFFLIALSASIILTSCNKDLFKYENGDSTISISQIHYLHASADGTTDVSTDYARLGETIRLTGTGFVGVKHVYVNGYDTYFNLQYLTNNSMLVTIDENTPIEQVNDQVNNKNWIVLVKENEAIKAKKALKIRRAAPVVHDISNSMPQPNEWITIYGENLQNVAYVQFPGADISTVYADGGDNLYSDDEKGTYVRVKVPANFDTRTAENNKHQGAIIINADHDGNGVCETPAYFNYRKGLLENFEEGSSAFNNSKFDASECTMTDEVSGNEDGTNDGHYYMMNSNSTYISDTTASRRNIYVFEKLEAFNNLPSELDELYSTDVALQFNVMCPQEWNSGNIDVVFDINSGNYKMTYAPWVSGKTDDFSKGFAKGSWFTVTMPFSTITDFQGKTFGEIRKILASIESPVWGIYFENVDQTNVLNGVSVEFKAKMTTITPCIDNIRVVPLTVVNQYGRGNEYSY